MKLITHKNTTKTIQICIALSFLILPVLAAESNDTLKMPSPVRGWEKAPGEAKTWAQTLLDWGALVAIVVAVGSLLYHFIKGRFADTSGSIQDRNDSTGKTIGTVVAIVILIISLSFLWSIFWK